MLERSGSVDHEPREGLREYGLAMEMELDMEKDCGNVCKIRVILQLKGHWYSKWRSGGTMAS